MKLTLGAFACLATLAFPARPAPDPGEPLAQLLDLLAVVDAATPAIALGTLAAPPPELLAVVRRSDSERARAARVALQQAEPAGEARAVLATGFFGAGDPEAVLLLTRRLAAKEAEVRWRSAFALAWSAGSAAGREAAPRLRECRSDPDPVVRRFAFVAACQLAADTPPADAELTVWLQSPEPADRQAGQVALLCLPPAVAAAWLPQISAEMWGGGTSTQARLALLARRAGAFAAPTLRELREKLALPRPEPHYLRCVALAGRAARPLLPDVLAVAARAHSGCSAAAIEVLPGLGAELPEVLPELLRLWAVADGQTRLRRLAIVAALRGFGPESIPALEALLHEDDPYLQVVVAANLGALKRMESR